MLDKIYQLFKDHPIEFLSLIIATLSAIFSCISYGVARRALSIAKKDFDSKQTNFNIYLIDSFSWTEAENDKHRYLFFNVSISNKSQSKSSYKGILELQYSKPDNSKGSIILEHQPNLIVVIPKMDLSIYPADIRIEERNTDSKWLIFKEPTEIKANNRIIKFIVKIIDINNTIQNLEVYLVKEIQNATEKN